MSDLDGFPGFPNAKFDYGYGPEMRGLREAIQASRGPEERVAFFQAFATVTWPESIPEPQNNISKRRSSLRHPGKKSELGEDDRAVVDGIQDAKQFIEAVLAEHPVRPFLDPTLTLHHLSRYRAWEKPSESLEARATSTVEDILVQRWEDMNPCQRILAIKEDVRKIAELLVEERASANLLGGGPIEGLPSSSMTVNDVRRVKKDIIAIATAKANAGKSRLDRDYCEMYDRTEEMAKAVRAFRADALAKGEQIQRNVDDLEILKPELSAVKAQVNSDARFLANRVAAAVEAQAIDTKIAWVIQEHYTQEHLASVVQAQVADALNIVTKKEADTASKLSDINRRLNDLESKPVRTTVSLLPWGTSSRSAADDPPSVTQTPPQ
ncbi:hypothetical protein DL771_001231 [Monosporascus sp. 5C6A]|nr:hypothetical protein DL771_001231 [Monosporascus sp. 5C6A]